MKNLKNLGKSLNKAEQKEVLGGFILCPTCEPTGEDCGNAAPCNFGNVCILGTCQCPD